MAARFHYEEQHLTAGNITEVLNERLPKLSRIRGSDLTDYVSTFLFSPIDVTSDHNTEVNYDLQGPDNCKVFPGDANWPSRWLWTGLQLATLGGLIKPVPMSQICYVNGTSEVNEAACATLADDWNTARFMCVTEAPLPTNASTDIPLEARTRSKL